jgi:hypothetical protein
MGFGLDPGKLGFKLGDVLVGLKSGTTDVPETITSDQGRLHTLGYVWDPVGLTYALPTVDADGGLVVHVANGGAVAAYALQLDDTGTGTIYVGEAQPGATTSAATWRIKRIILAGANLAIAWAGGDSNFAHVWNDRAGLTYS